MPKSGSTSLYRSAQRAVQSQNDEGPRVPFADPSLSTWLCTPPCQSTGIMPGTGTTLLQGKRLFDVMFKGQIPEQQLHPWSPGMPQPPDSWVPSAATTYNNLPSTVTTGDKAHQMDSDTFLPPFPPRFSFTATAVCLRWPGMKKALLLWWNTWDQVRPWLCREPNKWARAACVPIDSALAAKHHSQLSQL